MRAMVRRRVGMIVTSVAVCAGLAIQPIQQVQASPAAGSITEWPMFHHDSSHTGLSGDTAITGSTISQMGLDWEANTGSSTFTSPAVVLDQSLGIPLVILGNQDGSVNAYNADTGDRVWVFKTGAHVQASPAVVNGVVYIGGSDHLLHALDLTTGQQLCQFQADGVISSSPLVVNPDGNGLMVYFGDNGLTGTDDGGHEYGINAVDPNAAADCSLVWKFGSFGNPPGSQPTAGSWSPPSLGTDVNGRHLVFFGGSSPDCAVYALDAETGAEVWRFQTKIITEDNDVGAGQAITAPGVNGFVDGVVYATGKDHIAYALNLRTGEQIWSFDTNADSPTGVGIRSTPAIVGQRLYFGFGKGVYSLDAITGAKMWRINSAETISSPAVSGGATDKVVVTGDMTGKVRVYNATTGAILWTYQTGAFIYGSAAIADGHVYIASSDGFLYAFGPGGAGPSAPPTVTLSQPVNNSEVAYPGPSMAIAGTAGDDTAVQQVLVAVKNRNTNKWFDPSTNTWVNVFTQYPATLSAPGSTSTGFSSTFVPPSGGGEFFAQAESIDSDGQHSPLVAKTNFIVDGAGSPPDTAITSPKFKQVFYFPGGVRQSFPITVSGTATDTGGAHPGVAKVYVMIKNREHGEYFCGFVGCAGGGSGEQSAFGPTFKPVLATVNNAGATSVTWTITFPTYDHPHSYYVAAWAVDADGQQDTTRAQLARFCVNDPGDPFCA